MRISELMQKTPLNVIKDDPNSTTLEDPNTKVKTVVPKDPKKPGMITKDPQTNKATLNTKTAGPVSTLLKPGEKVEVTEKSVSKKQQRFMGMVHAAQKGEKPASTEVAKVAKNMKKKDAKDFASTKHKGLPEKK